MLPTLSNGSEQENSVVLDTNIFISGIFWQGDSYQVLELWRKEKIRLIISEDIIDEILSILINFKIPMPIDEANGRIQFIRENSTVVKPAERFDIVDDPSDNKFIECAVAGNAKYIITNDRHLLKHSGFMGINIMTPKAFLDKL